MPDVTALFTTLGNFGSLGILIAFLIWRDIRADALRTKLDEQHRSAQQLADEKRLSYDRERLEADKALAASLAALTSAVQSRAK